MEKQRRYTAEFSKAFSKVISHIIHECTENRLFRGKLAQKGKVLLNNPFTGYLEDILLLKGQKHSYSVYSY